MDTLTDETLSTVFKTVTTLFFSSDGRFRVSIFLFVCFNLICEMYSSVCHGIISTYDIFVA